MIIRRSSATGRTAQGVTIAALCGFAVLCGCGRERRTSEVEPEETIVPVAAVSAETAAIRAVVHASGVVAPAEGAEFLAVAPEPARILEITKAEGDPVTSGDILVRFELTSAAQDVARLAAELAGAQAQYENARINHARTRDFVEKGLIPRRDLDAADRELADAQAAVSRTRAAHAAAEAAAARAIVRAPFSGIVAARRYTPGDLVLASNADPVLRIVDPRRVEVIAAVPETDAARVVPGASARIAGPVEGQPVRLTVGSRLPASGDPGNTVPVRLLFVDTPQLAVDTRVEIDIDAEERTNTVLVPAEAVLREGGQTVLFVAAGSRAERRVVTSGISDDARVEITSGVKPGELVITRGHVGLPDGAAISVDVSR